MTQKPIDETDAEKTPGIRDRLAAAMHDPLQLRLALGVGLLSLWYFAGYSRMDAQIAATTGLLERDRKRLALARDIEALRVEEARFADRLPPRSDPNEFLQFILEGARSGPLKVSSLAPEKPKEAGPFQVATVKLDIEGAYPDLIALLDWVENHDRLLRVDTVQLDPDPRDDSLLKVRLIIVGLLGVEKIDTPRAGTKAKAKAGTRAGGDARTRPTETLPKADSRAS